MKALSFRLPALLLSLSLLVTACSGSDEPAASEASPSAQSDSASKETNVRVLQLRPSSFTRQSELTGTVEPWKSVTLAAEIGGKLENFRLTEGQTVRQGQVLGSVNARVLSAQKNQAEANYKLSQLQEKWQKQNLSKQVDLAETGYANAASTYSRQKQLYQEQVVSAQNFDNSETSLANSKLQLELQKISRSAGLEVNQQQTRVAAASLEVARVSLSQASISSPLSGYVNRVNAENGEVVSPGMALAEIVQMNPVKLTVGVPEREIAAVSLGQEVEVFFDALPDQRFKGQIIFIAAVAEQESKTFPIKIRLDNPGIKMRGGMIGRIALNQGRVNDAIVVPQDAVIDEKGGRFVFVEQDGIARKTSVTLGPRQGSEVVISSGLKAGDALITFGQRNVLDGDPVNVQERRFQGAPPPPEAQPASSPTASNSPAPATKAEG
ncbi:MAG: efflux RND transporter periplasmic adaptor subunit [Candidatus Sericytochromatia bacterium]|nr:efflux RND transporter periplasmic adaptor subunit [Candidatus Sericytochromatia bacterium]